MCFVMGQEGYRWQISFLFTFLLIQFFGSKYVVLINRTIESGIFLLFFSDRHVCIDCWKHFKYETGLKHHIKRECAKKPLACSQCDRKFTTKRYLRSHIERGHGSQNPIQENSSHQGTIEENAGGDGPTEENVAVESTVVQ